MTPFAQRLTTALARPRRSREIHERYALAIALWQEERRAVHGDFTGDQWARFRLLSITCHMYVPDAVHLWAVQTHREWGRFLYVAGLIGDGDTDAATLRAEIAGVDALAAEQRAY